MALMLAVDKVPQTVAQPAPPADPAVPAWVEAAMFGSVEELKAALDAGLDPNGQTANGTTVLMLAMPDAGKARLLLERGARADARAKSGYNALLVASRFRGSAEVIRLLLDRGATVSTPKGKPAAFGANPVLWTAYSGDIEATRVLLDSGARIEGAVSLGGLLPPWTALQIAAMQGDAAMVDLLASRGADVNAGDSFGVTPLSRAVLRNSLPTAKVLLTRGAKVNYVDTLGMTPLLYAATRDFGSSDMIRFLKAAKADSQVKTKEGKTAAALAMQFGHDRLAEAIGQ
jgi:ankyrin repeat protein